MAVEVISPSETVDAIEEKLIDYLDAGTRLVWLPRTQTITVYRFYILTINDTLDGGDVLPGFTTPVKEIFS